MPFLDLQSRFGVNLDGWLLLQSGQQPNRRAARCHAFEKEWIECAHGIGQTRAKKECQLEFEDFYECMHRQKTVRVFEGGHGAHKSLKRKGHWLRICRSCDHVDVVGVSWWN
uniref:NADH dehydrogenase [ubiquinone] iron-sulfur protein 5 n=1 Tax=Gasterosteus aculeatus aculeatus TaxID=481459 RepID=A0AAQ4QAC6_GASAC